MISPRSGHTATLLSDGRVLVVGGTDGKTGLASAELYDPRSGSWTATGSMATPRIDHTATPLPDGTVLVVGGTAGNTDTASAELYDPRTGTWSGTGSMASAREGHTATLLPDGEVLVAGGAQRGGPMASAELYDSVTGAWTVTGSMGSPRRGHAAALLLDGKVLVIGGSDHGGAGCCALTSAELYDPGSRTWTSTGNMAANHAHNTATLLPDGRVLVDGATHELYDPDTGTWAAASGTVGSCCAVTLLSDGRVLVFGADLLAEPGPARTAVALYDPRSDAWAPAGMLGTQRWEYTATLLTDGRVLVAGGWSELAASDTAPGTLASAELYDPVIAP
jgi:hypothetical protein